VVLGNQGLQYAQDTLEALPGIRWVLMPEGRLAFTVWSALPYVVVMVNALTHHLSSAVAASSLVGIALRDAATVRRLVDAAGFCAIEMQVLEFIEHAPRSAEAVFERTAGSSCGPDMTTIHEDARRVLGQEVCAALQAYHDGDAFVIPCRNRLVHARVA
jgi:hypothetical protein